MHCFRKCPNCDYILRSQSRCPECGMFVAAFCDAMCRRQLIVRRSAVRRTKCGALVGYWGLCFFIVVLIVLTTHGLSLKVRPLLAGLVMVVTITVALHSAKGARAFVSTLRQGWMISDFSAILRCFHALPRGRHMAWRTAAWIVLPPLVVFPVWGVAVLHRHGVIPSPTELPLYLGLVNGAAFSSATACFLLITSTCRREKLRRVMFQA